VNLEQISPNAAIAVIASEDNSSRFTTASISSPSANRCAPASTARGCVARARFPNRWRKNLFLWPGGFVRKAFEAYFTVLIEAIWPKERILEMYLNIAQFGDGVYGVEAAARHFYHKPAARLTSGEAAVLAAVLPNR